MTKPAPNFALLDASQPETAVLIEAMLCAHQIVQRRARSTAQQPISEDWWADVLADPRARRARQILVACGKCEWKAAFIRDDLIATHGADYPMPTLLVHLAAPGCPKIRDHWNQCGVYYVNPID